MWPLMRMSIKLLFIKGGGGMVESHKFRNFLYRIKFGPMDAGKAPVLDHSKIAKSFLSTTNYLAHFF